MKKHFYSHLVELDSLFISLDLLSMEKHEREELIFIVESSVHHVVLDIVLSELSEEDKKTFLAHLEAEKHDDIWQLLSAKKSLIERKIQNAVDTLKKNFHHDIKKVKVA